VGGNVPVPCPAPILSQLWLASGGVGSAAHAGSPACAGSSVGTPAGKGRCNRRIPGPPKSRGQTVRSFTSASQISGKAFPKREFSIVVRHWRSTSLAYRRRSTLRPVTLRLECQFRGALREAATRPWPAIPNGRSANNQNIPSVCIDIAHAILHRYYRAHILLSVFVVRLNVCPEDALRVEWPSAYDPPRHGLSRLKAPRIFRKAKGTSLPCRHKSPHRGFEEKRNGLHQYALIHRVPGL
jgi:hypothetical protein